MSPVSLEDLDTIQGTLKKIEQINNDILYFFDYLLLDDIFDLPQLIRVYGTIAEAYQDVTGNILLPQKPLLSEKGRKRVKTNA